MKTIVHPPLGIWILLVGLLTPVLSLKADQFGDFTFTDDGTSITITDYPASATGSVEIPSTIGEKPVTSIGSYAFRDCSGLASVTIPSSVTSIGNYAFYGCEGLASLAIPSRVTDIGNYAFHGCSGLTSVTIPSAVASIGHYAFRYCRGLESVTLSPGVSTIGNSTFGYCSSLTTVTIPSSVTSIASSAFRGCNGLTAFSVDGDNPNYSALDGALFDKSQTLLTLYPGGKRGAYAIPSGVTVIGSGAFAGCGELTSVIIPSSVSDIENHAFWDCNALTSVTIPPSVATIGSHAFWTCRGLTKVTISPGIASIGEGAFASCTGLTSVAVPASVGTIGESAFSGCTGLTSVTIAAGITSIEDYGFRGCSGLTSVTLPSSVTSLGRGAFQDCIGLESVTISPGIATLMHYVFSGCIGLTSVTIPTGVTAIASDAFRGCSGLASVTIPSGITFIGNGVFSGCRALTSMAIPSSVTSIGSGAFSYCSGLGAISVDGGNPNYSSAQGVLFDKSQTRLIQYPGGKVGGYTIPSNVTTIDSGAFRDCSGLSAIAVADGNLNYSSTEGVLFDKLQRLLIQYPEGRVGGFAIPDGITIIGNFAFSGCSGLTNVTIPSSVTSISSSAFRDCNGLSAISVDGGNLSYRSTEGVLFDKSQGNLIRCPGGKTGGFVIPPGTTSIGDDAFGGCSALTSVTIPSSVTAIGNSAFRGCRELTSLTIPASVSSIGSYALSYCDGLESVHLFGNVHPSTPHSVFHESDSITVYCFDEATGFTSPEWRGRPLVRMGPSSPMTKWLIERGIPHNTEVDADANGDGVSLLMACALNLDPNENLAGSMPQPVIQENQMRMTFYGATQGITYIAETSTDCLNWVTEGVTVSDLDPANMRTATVNRDTERRFLRLSIGVDP